MKKLKERPHLVIAPDVAEKWIKKFFLCLKDPEWNKRYEQWAKDNHIKTKKKSTKKTSSAPR